MGRWVGGQAVGSRQEGSNIILRSSTSNILFNSPTLVKDICDFPVSMEHPFRK